MDHAPQPIRIGISACLLGQEVRFDGGHKRDQFLADTLGQQVEWVPVCPEVEMGLGTPRETLRLVQDQGRRDSFRMVTTRTGIDHTDGMNRWAARRLDALARDEPDLCGYVLKKDSPSCGMERVKTYSSEAGMPERNGRGLFASALLRRFPTLPVEEEGRLNDLALRENFIERDLRVSAPQRPLRGGVVARRAREVPHGAQDGAARALDDAIQSTWAAWSRGAGRCPNVSCGPSTKLPSCRHWRSPRRSARHTNVLNHMVGHLKKHLDSESKQELVQAIEDYRQGRIPLVVPLTLLRHHVRVHGVEYLAGSDLPRRRILAS